MNELMIYQVFPLRALTDGQPSHGILEMIDWIPHIKKLGMNAVYFSSRILALWHCIFIR